jgi:hypothetical protein
VLFQTNPLGGGGGGRSPTASTLELEHGLEREIGRIEGRWSTEMVIPFKSLRFREPGPQTWGINFRRVIRWKNEYAGVTPMPAPLAAPACPDADGSDTGRLSVPTHQESR